MVAILHFVVLLLLCQLDGILRLSFFAAIMNCNFRLQISDFRLQISEVRSELLHFFKIDIYLFVKWNRI